MKYLNKLTAWVSVLALCASAGSTPAGAYDYAADITGNVNGNGDVSVTDVVILQKWLLGAGELPYWQNADMNKDGEVDIFDLVLLKKEVLHNRKTNLIGFTIAESHEDVENADRKKQVYAAQSLDELNAIFEAVEGGYSRSSSLTEEFFENQAAIVYYTSAGSGSRKITIDRIQKKKDYMIDQYTLYVYTTSLLTEPPTPDMVCYRYILAVDREALADVGELYVYEEHIEDIDYNW